MKTLIILLVAMSVGMFSCSKSEVDAHTTTTKKFVGTWDYNYSLNCGAGTINLVDEIVITKSSNADYDLHVVVPPAGEFEAEMTLGGAGVSPFFFVYFEDVNGVNTSITGSLTDGVLDIDGTTYDDSPLYYCAFNGTAQKQ